jgi:hypothetical protein
MVLALYATVVPTVVPGLGDARLLVTDLQATSQVRVVHEAPELALEAAVVEGVEAHRVAEKADPRCQASQRHGRRPVAV